MNNLIYWIDIFFQLIWRSFFLFQMIKGTIFNLMGSKLPAENFQQNPEAKSAWKGYLSVIANAIHKMTS